MEMLGVTALLIRPAVREERADPSLPPPELVKALAAAKAREAAAEAEAGDVVIAADTIVVFGGRVYGKPHSPAEAAEMLRTLSGRTHEVYTGVCVIRNGVELCRADRKPVNIADEIAHAVQVYRFVTDAKRQTLEVNVFNVMGLPLCMLGEMLKEQGVELL